MILKFYRTAIEKLSVNHSEKGKSLLDLVLEGDVLELLLSEHLFGFLASSDEIRHHCFRRSIWEVLVNFQVLVLGQFNGKLVTETFELGKSNSAVVNSEFSNLILGDLHTVNVMASHKEEGVLGQVLHHMLEVVVVALVSLLKRVPDGGLVMVLLGKLSLLVHVGSSNKLDAKVIAKNLRGSNLKSNRLFHSLQVLLVTIHNDVFLASVILLSQLLPK